MVEPSSVHPAMAASKQPLKRKDETMSSISGISSASSAWSNMSAMRGSRPPGGMDPAKMFAKVDADSSGSVDKTELQGLLDDIAQKTGVSNSSSDELFSKIDSNGDGSLSQDELGEGMKSIMPPPPSTMDFAQSRSNSSTGSSDDLFSKVDTDGDGNVSKEEMQTLVDMMDKMASSFGTDTTTSSSGTSDRFSQLDTDGNGTLSQTEFEAGRPQGGQGTQGSQGPQGVGGRPPPPPPGGASDSKSANSTSYDPLDTNQDGVVSAAERMAGNDAADAVQALFKSIDTDGDNKISSAESDTFITSLSAQYEASSPSAQDTANASSSQQNRFDLSKLVMMAYQQITSGLNQQSQGTSLSALA
jgi:Ca2+-binding EF-hand superfamily protein